MKLQNVHFNVEPELSARLPGCICLIYGSSIALRSPTWQRLKIYSYTFRAVHFQKLRATDVNCFYCGVIFCCACIRDTHEYNTEWFCFGKQYQEGIL